MCPSNNQPLSLMDLEIMIISTERILESTQNTLEALKELQERRYKELNTSSCKKENPEHRVMTYKYMKDMKRIREVQCICGEVTKYKKPLGTIEDFQCPKQEISKRKSRPTR